MCTAYRATNFPVKPVFSVIAKPESISAGDVIGMAPSRVITDEISNTPKFNIVNVDGVQILRMVCKEYVTNITATLTEAQNLATGQYKAYHVSAQSPYMPMLAQYGKLYEKWRLTRLQAEWKSSAPSTVGGSFALGWSVDPQNAFDTVTGNNFIRCIVDASGGTVFNTGHDAVANLNLALDPAWHYVEDSSDSDPRFSQEAVLYLGIANVPLVSGTGAQPYGVLEIAYEAEFIFPKLISIPTVSSVYATCTMATGSGATPIKLCLGATGAATGPSIMVANVALSEDYVYLVRWVSTTTAPVVSVGNPARWFSPSDIGDISTSTRFTLTSTSTADPFGGHMLYIAGQGNSDGLFNFYDNPALIGDDHCIKLYANFTTTTGAVYVLELIPVVTRGRGE